MPVSGCLSLARITADTVIAKTAKPLGQLPALRRDHSAFPRGEVLDRMETKDSQVRNTSDAMSAILGA